MKYHEDIQGAIKSLHGCESTHVDSVEVTETFHGDVAWKGVVEVFDLRGHHTASRCYGWGFIKDDKDMKYVTVLSIPPVTSPETAVKVYIASVARKLE